MERKVLTKVELPGNPVYCSGKIRETFLASEELEYLLMVSTDRISAFDLVLPTAIPDKGRVLNQLSIFWMKLFEPIVPNHLVSWEESTYLSYLGLLPPEKAEALRGRTVLVREAYKIPVECVVRGYLFGSYWQKYLEVRGEIPTLYEVSVHDHLIPGDLVEAQELPIPLFTPATKSEEGHDINLSYEEMIDHLKAWFQEYPEIKKLTTAELLTQNLKSTSLTIYLIAREYARQRGINIADTKIEYGITDGQLTIIDELLTPDSSRFWDAELYQPGQSPPSYDKQPVRDWLIKEAKWNKEPPAPELPEEVVEATTKRYREAYQRFTNGVLI